MHNNFELYRRLNFGARQFQKEIPDTRHKLYLLGDMIKRFTETKNTNLYHQVLTQHCLVKFTTKATPIGEIKNLEDHVICSGNSNSC